MHLTDYLFGVDILSESKKEESPDKVRFVYHKPEDYKQYYVNGVYGGMTPRGELLCHFFVEYADIPAEERLPLLEGVPQLDKAMRVERIKHSPKEIVLRRDVRVGLIIPAHQISSVANWMLDKLKASKIVVEKKEG